MSLLRGPAKWWYCRENNREPKLAHGVGRLNADEDLKREVGRKMKVDLHAQGHEHFRRFWRLRTNENTYVFKLAQSYLQSVSMWWKCLLTVL